MLGGANCTGANESLFEVLLDAFISVVASRRTRRDPRPKRPPSVTEALHDLWVATLKSSDHAMSRLGTGERKSLGIGVRLGS
jgi:hypothetical protein